MWIPNFSIQYILKVCRQGLLKHTKRVQQIEREYSNQIKCKSNQTTEKLAAEGFSVEAFGNMLPGYS